MSHTISNNKKLLFFIGSLTLFALLVSGCNLLPPTSTNTANENEKEGEAMMEEGDHMMDDDPSASSGQDGAMMDDDPSASSGQDGAMMEEGEKMMEGEDKITDSESKQLSFTGTVLAGSKAKLIDFNKADYEKALASDKLVVLYFYANWCPICKQEVANGLYPAFNEVMTDEVVGFRVNYNDNETDDNEKNLAKQFGVAYQHTKVFLKNGQRIKKAPDSWNKARYLSEINNAI
jgi:thiol-disulfide isomerase/thioredoxin